MKRVLYGLIFLFLIFGNSSTTYGHCQVPCGIYDDYMRVKSMLEDASTVRKAMNKIVELSGKNDALSKNQMVRWVMNKEQHAQNIIDTVSDYFLTQRVKSDQSDYLDRLAKHHSVITSAMKVKQNVDLKYVVMLEESIGELLEFYPKHTH